MASILNHKLNDRIKGDTFSSVQFEYIDSDTNNPVDLTGAFIEVDFMYRCKTGNKVLQADSNSNGVDITTPLSGLFVLEAFTPITWEIGTYFWDVKVTFADGTKKTYIQGTVKILQD
tara:strand:+ start:1233 stop:1583 length:351 start_codon:yes stop_codon:yes gene_type:complete